MKTTTYAKRLTILNDGGVCARAACVLVRIANRYDAEILFANKDGRTVSAKDIMDVITLGLSQGMTMEARATGPEALEAMEEITAAVNRGLNMADTGEMLPVPQEHSKWVFGPEETAARTEASCASRPSPAFRVLRVAYSLGNDASAERRRLLRNILPSLRQRVRPARMLLRRVDLGPPEACEDVIAGLNGDLPAGCGFLLLDGRAAPPPLHRDAAPDTVDDLRGLLARVRANRVLEQQQINALVRSYRWNERRAAYVAGDNLSEAEKNALSTVFHRIRTARLRNRCLVLFRAQPQRPEPETAAGISADSILGRRSLEEAGWSCADYADPDSFDAMVRPALARWLEHECNGDMEEPDFPAEHKTSEDMEGLPF